MPSSPKIPKDRILKAALDLLIEEGYHSVTIKAVAEKLNSSTQPVSWHFGNMDGFRKALADYALSFANGKMKTTSENSVTAFTEVGNAYVDIAFDTPNLFKYLYLDGGSGYCVGTFETFLSAVNNPDLIRNAADFFAISGEKASEYLTNTIIYSHGLLSLVVAGVLKADRQSIKDKINNAGFAFLLQAGGDLEKAEKAENHLKAIPAQTGAEEIIRFIREKEKTC